LAEPWRYNYTDFGEGRGKSPHPVLRAVVEVSTPGATATFQAIVDTGGPITVVAADLIDSGGDPLETGTTIAKIVEHAARQEAVYSYRGEPMVAISVDLTIPGWSVERILRERIWSRSRYATTTAGALRSAGYELVPTSRTPHYSIVLPEASEVAAVDLSRTSGLRW
jgi:hypothetical protein